MSTKAELCALVERVMALTGPCRNTDIAIHDALGLSGGWSGPIHPHDRPRGVYTGPAFTASLDAAMTLADPRYVSDILHRAWSALAKECSLHIRFYDEVKDGSFAQRLARHITAQSLLARAEALL